MTHGDDGEPGAGEPGAGDAGDGDAGLLSRRRPIARAGVATALVIALALGVLWARREAVADYFVTAELKRLGLPARYRIESIEPGRQVVRDIVVGDPARPDLVIPRAVIRTGIRGGVPVVLGVTLERPRLRAKWLGGRLSLGSLDALFKGPSTGAPRLPMLDLAIIDGRAVVATRGRPIGLGFYGRGGLRGGFSGAIGASWSDAVLAGCSAARATFAGRVRIAGERPEVTGPLRVAGVDCGGLAVGDGRLDIAARLAKSLDGGEAGFGVTLVGMRSGATVVGRLGGKGRATLHGAALSAKVDFSLDGLAGPTLGARRLGIEGVLRGDTARGDLTVEGRVSGKGLGPGRGVASAILAAAAGAKETPAGALLARIGQALARQSAESSLDGRYVMRAGKGGLSLLIPQARLDGAGGGPMLSLSRLGMRRDSGGLWQASGSFRTGGRDLPVIEGRISSDPAASRVMLAMAPYRAGGSEMAVPALAVVVNRRGRVGFAGQVAMSGPVPGGEAKALALPVSGDWSADRGLAVGRQCLPVRFGEVRLASLTLARDDILVCPGKGRAIVERGPRGMRISAGITRLALAGTLGGSPAMLRSGAVGIAMPGVVTASAIEVVLGKGEGVSRFALKNVVAQVGHGVGGRFAGVDVALGAVPLDVRDASGSLRYVGGRLELSDASLRVVDRSATAPRFAPLVARGASLVLAGGRITSDAELREPRSDRVVARLDLRHDLASGRGRADLAVPGIVFDKSLQPDTLTPLALGVIANVTGKVTGDGEIDWTPDKVTSRGRFSTDSLDLAAAFGPAKGVAGTVEFTDLLGLVTAPGQQLRIASINPGIEVDDGALRFAMKAGPNQGHVLAIEGAQWPFLDGRLELLPTSMTLGVAETRRYVLKVTGISAARFIERMEISNLAATGTFDGSLPLMFDQNGGHIEDGSLVSRAPGGSVSYVGELSYKDLSPMANFAFQTLRSLDYKRMTIGMDGPLAGELVTRISMGGVTQGAGAKKNLVTRQLARLPIRFDVNIRAPFFQLVTSFKSFWDPKYLIDPRTLGLLDAAGRPIGKAPSTAIQPPVSEQRP